MFDYYKELVGNIILYIDHPLQTQIAKIQCTRNTSYIYPTYTYIYEFSIYSKSMIPSMAILEIGNRGVTTYMAI